MSCKTKKGYAANPRATERRNRVIQRLEAQLKSGMKPGEKPVRGIDVPLEERYIKRIEKELTTLKARV